MTAVERRFLAGFRELDSGSAGLIQKDDGTIWLVNPDGSETQLPGGGGSAVQVGSGTPVGSVTPSGIGAQYLDSDTDTLYVATGVTSADWAATGGGSQPGVSIIRKFAFAFDTAGILTGATIYTPSIGDILLNAWIEVVTAWDGTTPLCDIGPFGAGDGHSGWLGYGGWGPCKLAQADIPAIDSATTISQNGASAGPTSELVMSENTYGSAMVIRNVPVKFVAADPIKVCVSQNGKNNGADPGSTVGSGIVYLVTATPT